MTVLGDGSGDASTTGVAPEANLVMYALEHDPTVTLDVKAPSMTSFQMLNSRPPELQSTLGVRTETLDSTLQIQDR